MPTLPRSLEPYPSFDALPDCGTALEAIDRRCPDDARARIPQWIRYDNDPFTIYFVREYWWN